MAQRVADGDLTPEEISESDFHSATSLSEQPAPDLFIRTGGEHRISNFLIWQLAYSELYFTDVLWPDFNKEHLFEAFASYTSRQRRYGKTGQQVEAEAVCSGNA